MKIGDWEVDPERNELRRGAETTHLEPKAIEVLAYLAGRPGKVVKRDELLGAIWPGVIVGDDALTQAIIKLRKALADDAHRPKYIETISKRGYRLIAPVAGDDSEPGTTAAATRRRSSLPMVGGILALLVFVVGGFAVMKGARMPWPIASDTRGTGPASAFPVVAVLPLANLSGDPKREHFSDGLTEDLIDALGRFSGLRVMSRNAVLGYKGKSPTPQAILQELGARYIVQGSVREAGEKMRVAVELTDAEQGAQLWSERYDGEGRDVFEIQDRIVRNIVAALATKVTRVEERRAFTRPTESLEAYELLLRARALISRQERGANREARSLLAKAQGLAPDYAEILTAQCQAEFHRAMFGWIEDVVEGARRAEELCKSALASADQRFHTRAHAMIASVYSNQNRWEEALSHAERAIALNPSDAVAMQRRGTALLYTGRVDEAIETMEAAARFDPHTFDSYNLTVAYFVAGRYRDALGLADVLVGRYPQSAVLHAIRAAALAELGKEEEARRAAEEVRRFSPYFRAEHFGTRFANQELAARLREAARKAGL